MRLFSCDKCQAPIYFDNFRCVSCDHPLAFLPDLGTMSTLEEVADGDDANPKRYRALGADGRLVRMCQNHVEHQACSWAVPDDDPEPLCRACRLNEIIPDLSDATQRDAWQSLEAAKRRLLYSLFLLKLPVEEREEGKTGGLGFSFMAGQKEHPVFTGHSDGLITINVAEADDPFREKMRAQLGEAYRTVLGHFRHEIGHYYWDRLIKDSDPLLERYRELFGDETEDYQEALDRHYKEGAPADWATRFVSQYASMHPWEDWAETWAHYLHIFDTLETAKAYGLSVKVGRGTARGETVVNAEEVSVDDFDQMAQDWVPLTLALNSLNRSMGMRDLYPFVLTGVALNKLRFVHEVIKGAPNAHALQRRTKPAPSKPAPVAVVEANAASTDGANAPVPEANAAPMPEASAPAPDANAAPIPEANTAPAPQQQESAA